MDSPGTKRPLVLVVDDHRDTAELLAKLLKLIGYPVQTTCGYAEALAAARAGRVDILLTDIDLADGDGCDLLAEVSALYPVRSIAITAHGLAAHRAKCEAAGFEFYLLKPVQFDELRNALSAAQAMSSCPPAATTGNRASHSN